MNQERHFGTFPIQLACTTYRKLLLSTWRPRRRRRKRWRHTFKFNDNRFYVIGTMLSGELSCPGTSLVNTVS